MNRMIALRLCSMAFLLPLVILTACSNGSGAQGDVPPAAVGEATAPAQEQELAAGDSSSGAELFASACAACHGPDAKGIANLGKDLTTSEFAASLSDAELIAFIKEGRPSGDPLNTTGVEMPPKGGNPAITDAQLADIVAYVRTLQP